MWGRHLESTLRRPCASRPRSGVWAGPVPLMPKRFNQARIPNEWRLRVCWGLEEEGRQFLEMITDSFPCLSCLWKRETPTPTALRSTPPPPLYAPATLFCIIVGPLLNIWRTRSSLLLLLFMSGAVPSPALVSLKWESQLSLKLMAGNLQLTSPTAVSSASFFFSSRFLPFLRVPPCCFVFPFSPPRTNQKEDEGNGPACW